MQTFTKKEQKCYLTGLAGQTFLYAITMSLAYYFQFTLLIPAMAVSVILASNQIWDTFKDPIMGSIIDRTRSKWGKARPWLLFTPLPVGILTVLCFVNGVYDPAQGMAGRNLLIVSWAAASYFLWSLAYTAGDIPLHSLPALMTDDRDDRTKLISMKTIAGLAGSLGVAVQPLALQAGRVWRSERLGFIAVVIPLALVAAALFQLAGLFTRERVALTEKVYSLKENFQVLWRNKPSRAVLLSGILASPKSAEGVAMMPFISYYYANKDPGKIILYSVILASGSYVGKILAVKLTQKLVAKYEKAKLYNFSNLMIVPPTLFVFLLYLSAPTRMADPLYVGLTALAFTVAGTFHALVGIITPLFTADAVDYEEYHHHSRPDGMFASEQTMITKVSAGVSSLIGGAVYALVGFSGKGVEELNRFIDAGGIARTSAVFRPYMTVLFFLFTVPTVIGALLSMIPTWRYPLSDAEHARVLAELKERRRAGENLQ